MQTLVFVVIPPILVHFCSSIFVDGCERGQGRGAGGSAGGASLTPMKKLGAMTGNFINQNDHILAIYDQKCIYFPEMAPRGSKISVDVFNSKVSDLTIVSAIRKSLTS